MRNHETAQAYPLQWPVTTPRTKEQLRKRSSFGQRPWDRVVNELRHELDLLGAKVITISTNQPIRKDGNPFAQVRRIDDPGVAVYFQLEGMPICLPCDRFLSLGENLRAITLHVAAMRGMERWGVGTSKQAFAGYKALAATVEENWWDVLECRPDASTEIIQAQYRSRVRTAHPDSGGSVEAMQRLNVARDRALEARA